MHNSWGIPVLTPEVALPVMYMLLSFVLLVWLNNLRRGLSRLAKIKTGATAVNKVKVDDASEAKSKAQN